MDIGSAFVANSEPLEMSEPGKGPLHNPAMLSELLSGFNTAARDPGKDAAHPAGQPASPKVVRLVRMQFLEATPWPPAAMADSRHSINHLFERDRVMLVRGADQHRHGDAIGIGDQVMLGSVLSTVGWVRADRFAPLFALMLEASRAPRSQSILPASFSSSSRVR